MNIADYAAEERLRNNLPLHIRALRPERPCGHVREFSKNWREVALSPFFHAERWLQRTRDRVFHQCRLHQPCRASGGCRGGGLRGDRRCRAVHRHPTKSRRNCLRGGRRTSEPRHRDAPDTTSSRHRAASGDRRGIRRGAAGRPRDAERVSPLWFPGWPPTAKVGSSTFLSICVWAAEARVRAPPGAGRTANGDLVWGRCARCRVDRDARRAGGAALFVAVPFNALGYPTIAY